MHEVTEQELHIKPKKKKNLNLCPLSNSQWCFTVYQEQYKDFTLSHLQHAFTFYVIIPCLCNIFSITGKLPI